MGSTDWENLHWLFERLASLGIMGAQLRASFKLRYHSALALEGLHGALCWYPMMPREISLSDGCTPDRCKLPVGMSPGMALAIFFLSTIINKSNLFRLNNIHIR